MRDLARACMATERLNPASRTGHDRGDQPVSTPKDLAWRAGRDRRSRRWRAPRERQSLVTTRHAVRYRPNKMPGNPPLVGFSDIPSDIRVHQDSPIAKESR
jgi:hypothetical protein